MVLHLERCVACREVVGALLSSPRATSPGPPMLEREARVGRYVILELVGQGAMGKVYVAHDPELDRKVALKLLRERWDGDPASDPGLRLRREAQAMARLSSRPEVVTIHDVGIHEGYPFVAMEFVEGGTVREWLRERPRSWREVLEVFLMAGRGLAAAHEAGLVHRDFKPDNVLVGVDGRAHVTDFGLARGLVTPMSSHREASSQGDRLGLRFTRTGALVGTPAYMAPEQMTGGDAGVSSDIFSYCVSLYEAFYGERPFEGETLEALRTSVLGGAVRRAPRGSLVPIRLRRALLVGLRAEPSLRHRSMPELLETLRLEAARASSHGGARAALGAGALLALALGGGGLAAWMPRRGATSREHEMSQVGAGATSPGPTQSASAARSASATIPTPGRGQEGTAPSASGVARAHASASAPPHAPVVRQPMGGASPFWRGGSYAPYERAEVEAAIEQRLGAITRCFVQTRFEPPEHQTACYTLSLDPSGVVTGARGTTDLERCPKLDACMIGVLRTTVWPRTPAGGSPSLCFSAPIR